ncbi:glycosyltransferase [Micromonospora echinofusca]|uniref:Glycosyltransferase n=1 Tax=Micromonospora echinofusca TaxID=47858 RepID=A0ABS3VSU1_MICEH|nr:glycosyltransferase [Micromonospora echinofusca]
MSRPLETRSAGAFRAAGRELDVLVPTRNRATELAVTLAGLAAQEDVPRFGVVVSDQSDGPPPWAHPAVAAMVRALRHRGCPVLLTRRLPRRGLAEHRAYLLAASSARYVLCLDDDVWLEPGTVARLWTAIRELGCGFVGNAVHGLSYLEDCRPETHRHYAEWPGKPVPERIRPGTPEWDRARIHSAANLLHVTAGLELEPGGWRAYKISWIGGCVLYDRACLVASGGFDFWHRLPERHQGEDVAAQLAVLERFGGAGILPSGAYHLESPTTVTERDVEAWEVVLTDDAGPGSGHPPVSSSAAAANTSLTGTSVTNESRCGQLPSPGRSG